MESNHPKCMDVLATARSSAINIGKPGLFNSQLKGIKSSLSNEFLEAAHDSSDEKDGLNDFEEHVDSDIPAAKHLDSFKLVAQLMQMVAKKQCKSINILEDKKKMSHFVFIKEFMLQFTRFGMFPWHSTDPCIMMHNIIRN